MSVFNFLKNKNHEFFSIQEEEIEIVEKKPGIAIPKELRDFYLQVGYGFIKGNSSNSINRLLDPDTIADINLRQGIYENDPDLNDIYEDEDKLIFYEVNEGVYLTLERNKLDNNPVYFFDVKVADSLLEFLKKIDENDQYFTEINLVYFWGKYRKGLCGVNKKK